MSNKEVEIMIIGDKLQSWVARQSFLTMDSDNENEVFAVDANEIAKYIEELTGSKA